MELLFAVPSALMPIASASATEPFSVKAFFRKLVSVPAPFSLEKAISTAPAVAVETAVTSPELVIVSLPVPPSIPMAFDFAMALAEAVLLPSVVTARSPDTLVAVATVVTFPVLSMVSLPDAAISSSLVLVSKPFKLRSKVDSNTLVSGRPSALMPIASAMLSAFTDTDPDGPFLISLFPE